MARVGGAEVEEAGGVRQELAGVELAAGGADRA